MFSIQAALSKIKNGFNRPQFVEYQKEHEQLYKEVSNSQTRRWAPRLASALTESLWIHEIKLRSHCAFSVRKSNDHNSRKLRMFIIGRDISKRPPEWSRRFQSWYLVAQLTKPRCWSSPQSRIQSAQDWAPRCLSPISPLQGILTGFYIMRRCFLIKFLDHTNLSFSLINPPKFNVGSYESIYLF